MQSVPHRDRHKSAACWFRLSQQWIKIRYPVLSLMYSAVVLPADEFDEYQPKIPFVPDQNSIQTFSAKRTCQPFHVCCGIGRTVGNQDPTDAHLFPDPCVECRSTRYALSIVCDLCRTTELTEFIVVSWRRNLGCSIEQAFLICCFVQSVAG